MSALRPAAAPGSLDELLDRAARGDVHAFARVVRQRHEAVTRVALPVTLDAGLASQAATAAFVDAWLALRGTRWTGAPRPHDPAAFDRRLSVSAATSAATLVEFTETVRSYVGGDGAREGSAAADGGALEPFHARQRALLVLSLLLGLSTQEIADVTHGRPGDVESEIARLAPGDARDTLEAAVRTQSAGPVPQVDADRVARQAVAEQEHERERGASVAVGAAVGLFVAVFPLLAQVLFRH